MNSSLRRKRYTVFYIIPFLLSSLFFGNRLQATPECPILSQSFSTSANGATIDASSTGWYVDSSNLHAPHPSGYYFAVQSHRFDAVNLGGVGIWYSRVFSIAGYKAPQVSVKITAEGLQDSTEYVQVYYKLDGGAMVLIAQQNGNFGTQIFTSPTLSGSNVQMIVKVYDYNNGKGQSSKYHIEQYNVFQTSGPCTPGNASIPVSISASNSGTLTCSVRSVTLTPSSSTSGLSYWWTGPNNYSSRSSNPSVSTVGTYTLIVNTSSAWGTASYTVTTNTTPPAGVMASNNGPITCNKTSVTLTGASTTSGTTFKWAGPNSFSVTGASVSTSTPGTYTVTATNPATGCTATSSTTVVQNSTAPSGVTATNNGPLTCTKTSVSLTGNSSASGVSYNWTGPNGLTYSTATAAVSTAGVYTLTVTNPQNGCTASASTTVAQDLTGPAGLAISKSSGSSSDTSSGSAVLTCSTTSVTLTASSTTTGVSYSWSGPNSTTSSAATITARSPGTYIVTAINPATGCTSTASTMVTQDTTSPVALTTTAVPVSAQLTCTNNSVTFTAGSSTPGVSYTWSGPDGALPSSAVATVSAVGTYTLTATNPVNGCTASASSTVTQNITAPGGVTTTADPTTAQITCIHPSILLTSSSTTPGVTYGWSGPDGFTAAGAVATASAAGTYTVTVTDPANGCVTVLPGTVTKNVSVPVGLSASASDIISCFSPTINLQGVSTTPGATFSWSGPGGFTASTAVAETDLPGSYNLIVTNPVNGCTASTGTIVTADTATPANVTASNNGPLNCINTSVTITSSSSTPGMDYLWITPDNNFLSGATAVVTTAGLYTIVVTNDDNGCFSQSTTTVLQNTTGCTGSSALTPASTGNATARSMQGVTVDSVTGFQYRTYPNPFSSSAFIEFTAPTSSPVTVEIYSSYGYREKLLFNSMANANQAYKLDLSAAGLSSGAHFCIIRNGAKVYAAKLLLIK